MKHNKFLLIFVGILSFGFSNYVYANENAQENSIGAIHINDSAYKENQNNNNVVQDKSSVGVLSINDDLKKTNSNNYIKNETYQKLISELETITSLQNKKDYSSALNKIIELKQKFPEILYFQKWEAIYQNKLKNYTVSEDIFNDLLLKYPFEADVVNNDLIIKYYRIDNHIQLGEYDLAEKELNTLKKSINDIPENQIISDINKKDLYQILLKYQMFILNNYSHKEEDIDKENLDELWEVIPIKYQKHLDNFYGYDLSELEYLYGKYYNRKDILKAYVQQEKTNAVSSFDIQKIKNAKSIFYREY